MAGRTRSQISEDEKKISEAKTAVDANEGSARLLISNLNNKTWDDFKKNVLGMFARGERYYAQQLMAEKWRAGEDFGVYCTRLLKKERELNEILTTLPTPMSSSLLIMDALFMLHLPQEGFTTLREKPTFTSIDNFKEMTYKARLRLDELGQSTKGAEKRTTGNVAAVYTPPKFSNKENQPDDQKETRRNTNNFDNNGYRRNDASRKAQEDFHKKEIICFNCNRRGHISTKCTRRPYCPHCKREGHTFRTCSRKPVSQQSNTQDRYRQPKPQSFL